MLSKPYKCRSCKIVLGESDGQILTVGPIVLLFTTTFRCQSCGGMCVWRPATNNEANDESKPAGSRDE